jgi:hypothetical protein
MVSKLRNRLLASVAELVDVGSGEPLLPLSARGAIGEMFMIVSSIS